MKMSEDISAFLGLIRGSQAVYDMARARESDAEKETQDILHWLESNEVPDIDGDGAILVLGVIGMARRDRRSAKNMAAVTKPIAEWAKAHKSTMDSLAQLLGDVRKAEKGTENRHYTDRTDIMKEILGDKEDGQ